MWPCRHASALVHLMAPADLLQYLHHAEPPILHRELTTRKVLLDQHYRASLVHIHVDPKVTPAANICLDWGCKQRSLPFPACNLDACKLNACLRSGLT